MTHEMLFTGWYGIAIFACSVAICLSYQLIPSALEVIEQHGRDNEKSPWLVSITSSIIFRIFIRACGFNHIVMSGVMLAVAKGVISPDDFWRTVLLAGEASVAIVSVLSAISTWRVKWLLEKS